MAIDYKKFFDLMNEVNAYAETNIDNNIPQDAQLALTDFRRKLQPVAEQLNVYKEKVESGNYPMEERTAAETQLTAALKELAEEAQNAMAADGPEVTKHIFSMYHDGINGVLPEPAPVQAPEIAPAEGNNAGPQLQNHEAPEPHPMYNYQAFKDAIDEADRSANAEAHPHEPEDVHAARRDFRRDLSTATQRLRIYKDLLNRGEAYPAVEREKNKNQLAKNLAALALEAKKQIDSLDVRLQDTKLKPLEADELRFNRTLYSQYLAGLESVFPYFDIATPPWASHEVTGTAAYAKFDEVLFGRLFDKAEGVRTVGGVEEFLRSYTAARPAEIDLLNGFTAFEARLPGLKDAFRLFHTMKENDTFNNAQDLQQAQDYLIGQLGELRDSAKQLAAGITEAMKTMPPENPDYAKLGNVLSYYTACMQTVYQIDALNEVAAASNDAFTQLAGRSAAMFEAIEASGNLEDRSAHIAPELKDIYKDLLKFRETAAAKPFEETYHALEAQEAAIQERLGAWEGRKHFEDLLGELDAVSIDRLTSIKNDISIAAIQTTNKLIDKYRVSKLLKSFVDDRADKSYREFYTSICRDALSGSLGTPIDPEMVRSARKAGGVSKLRIRGQDGMFPIATAKEFSRYLENEMQAVRSLRPDEIDRFHDDNAFLIENANRIDEYIALKTIDSSRTALRNCIWDLRNRALEEDDLEAAIRLTLAPHVGGTDVTIRFPVDRAMISDTTAHAFLSIIRELTLNAIRHGGASAIKIAGAIENGRLLFSVRDNGCGFDPERCPGMEQGHFGLQGVRERAKEFKGQVRIDSRPGAGAKVTITIPLPRPDRT